MSIYFTSFKQLLSHGQYLIQRGEVNWKDMRLDTHVNEHLSKDEAIFVLINQYMFTFYSTDYHDLHQSLAGMLPLSIARELVRECGDSFFHLIFNPLNKHVHFRQLPSDFGVPLTAYATDLKVSTQDELFLQYPYGQTLEIQPNIRFTYGYHLATVEVASDSTLYIPEHEAYKFGFQEAGAIHPHLFQGKEDPLVVCFIEDMIACRKVLYRRVADFLQL